MATRANIELYDGWAAPDDPAERWVKGVVLYHHYDGYPSWMGPELECKLHQAQVILQKAGRPYWWDSERVGALMVALSATDSPQNKQVPHFQPCVELHRDIAYLWRVYLGPQAGQYDLQCFEVVHDWDKDSLKSLTPVDWQAEVEDQPER